MATLTLFSPHDAKISRVLCVVAHPDDMEYGGSAAVAEWVDQGIEVAYVLLTAGEAGMRDTPPAEAARLRAREQRAACDVVGVDRLTILDLPDGLVEPSIETRRRIAQEIRAFRPDAIFTMSWNLEAGWGLNHADHRSTGLAVVDAIRDADNPWLFQEQLEEDGLEAWKTNWLLVTMHQPQHAIAVGQTSLKRGIASLAAHREYLAALTDHPTPEDLVTNILTDGGDAAGVPLALPVRVYQM